MLKISKLEDGRTRVEINFSSLSLINSCLRKSQYALIEGIKSNQEAEATLFGKAIHKALEHWYALPADLRRLTSKELDMADTLIGGPLGVPSEPYETSLDSINEFVKVMQPLRWMANEDKRSIHNGIKILKAYFDRYIDDGLEVYRDSKDQPMLEREVEFTMHEDSEKVVVFHGTIDMILYSPISGQIFVCDHKTTHALGTDFFNKIKPNHQYTGYVWAAREVLGIDTTHFLVNGIQVAKTKCEFARQPTERKEEDFIELKMAVLEAVDRLLNAVKTGRFPMNTQVCSNFGACQYLPVCSAPAKLRDTVLKGLYS